jgi:hypothetical protein
MIRNVYDEENRFRAKRKFKSRIKTRAIRDKDKENSRKKEQREDAKKGTERVMKTGRI